MECKHKHTQESVQKIFSDGGCELVGEYKANNVPVEYRCKCGSVSKITLMNFRLGKRCRNCFSTRRSGHNNHMWNPDRDRVEANKAARERYYSVLHNVLRSTGKKKNTKSREILGYGIQEFGDHIKSSPEWSTLKDNEWHVDHIFPVSAFLDYGITDVKIINSLDNLRPLAKNQNLSKSDKYVKEEFELWLESKGVIPRRDNEV